MYISKKDNIFKLKYDDKLEFFKKDLTHITDFSCDQNARLFYTGTDKIWVENTKETEKAELELPNGWYRYINPRFDDPYFEQFNLRDDLLISNLQIYETLTNEIYKFLRAKDIYEKHNIAYKRGILLYGPPGTGKTSYIRNVCKNLTHDIMGIWCGAALPPMDWLKVLNDKSCLKIYVLEELLTHVENHWAQLLDFLDGETTLTNSLIIATTNFPEKLPDNIVSRCSRFDTLLLLDDLPLADKFLITEQFLQRSLTSNEKSAIEHIKLNIASLKEISILMLTHSMSFDEANNKVQRQLDIAKKNFKQNSEKLGFGSDE